MASRHFGFVKTLCLHVIRSSYEIRYRLFLISFICASTFGIIAGPYSAIENLFQVVRQSQESSNLADLELITAPEDIKNIPNFKLGELDNVENRLLLKANLVLENKNVSALFIGQNSYESQKINLLVPILGSLPKDNDVRAVGIERNCADYYNKEIGDTLFLKINQSSYYLTIESVVQSPEYLMAPVNSGVYIPSSGSLCVIFGNKKLMNEHLGFEAFNSLLFKFSHPDIRTQSEIINIASTRLSIDYALNKDEQFNKKFLDQNLNVFKVFIPVIVLVFLITTGFSISFLMRQWINRERSTISMMMIFGYKKFHILMAYAIPLFFILFMTIIFGHLFAFIDAWAFGVNYARAIKMPDPSISLNNYYLLFATALTFLSIIIGMYFPLKLIFDISPLDAMRKVSLNGAPSSFFRKFSLIIRGPFWFKYPVRDLIRYWQANLISIIAIALSIATTICFNITSTSMKQTAFTSFSKDNWQAVIDMDTPFWNDEAIKFQKAIPNSVWSTFVKGGVQVSSGTQKDNAFIIGIDIASNVRMPVLIEGRGLKKANKQEVVVERSLASKQKVNVGDPLNILFRNHIYKTTIVGIHSSAMPNEIIMDRALAAHILSFEDQFTGVFLISPKLDSEKLKVVNNIFGVTGVTVKDRVYSAIEELSDNINVIINISIFISIFISVLFIISSTSFTLDAKANDYGLLRAMGYSETVVAKTIIVEILLITFMGSILAIPLGILFSYLLNEQLTQIWFKVTTTADLKDFISVILPTMGLIPFASLPLLMRIFNGSSIGFIAKKRLS